MNGPLQNNLRACLAEKNIRQWQLARRLNKSRPYVSRLCNGQIQPSLEMALTIAHCLNLPVEAIFQLIAADSPRTNFSAVFPSAAGSNP